MASIFAFRNAINTDPDRSSSGRKSDSKPAAAKVETAPKRETVAAPRKPAAAPAAKAPDEIQTYMAPLEPYLKSAEQAQIASTKAQTEYEQSKADVELQVGAEKAAEAEINAKKQREIFESQRSLRKEHPAFAPDMNNLQNLGKLFSLITTLGVLGGGSGKLGAQNAMFAMTGMLKGYSEGNEAEFNRQKAIYDENIKAIDAFNEENEKDLNRLLELQKTDAEAAALQREMMIRKNGSQSIFSKQLEVGNLSGAAETQKARLNLAADAKKQAEQAKIKAEELRIAADERIRYAQISADERERLAEIQAGYKGGATARLVQDYVGEPVTAAEATQISGAAAAIDEASQLSKLVDADPGLVGREGQVRQFVNRYVDSAINNKPMPSDQEFGDLSSEDAQSALIFAKRYAAYLVNYERSLAPGSRGFTVAFQNRFNNLMQQNQFNATGFKNLLKDQQREVATQATRISKGATLKNLTELGASISGRATGTTTPAAAPSKKIPTGATLKGYADEHFGGDQQKAIDFLKTQGYE